MPFETQDLIKLSKDNLEELVNYIQEYVKENSTTRLLVNGTLILISFYALKGWINCFRLRRELKLDGPIPLPLIGNLLFMIKHGIYDHTVEVVKKYGKTSVLFAGSIPMIYTADQEMIKQIAIKDFRYFTNLEDNETISNLKPFNAFLTILKDEKWKNVRSIVTSVFTTGKLKQISGNILKIANILGNNFKNLSETNEYLNATKTYSCLASDIIYSSFFGIEVDSLKDPNNPIVTCTQAIAKKNWKAIFILTVFPSFGEYLMKKGYLSFVSQDALSQLEQITDEIIESRRSKKVRRDDFIQMMVDLEKQENEEVEKEDSESDKSSWKPTKRTLTNDEIRSQCLLFMLAGSETISTTLTNISYMLALHPECQSKLIEEIQTVIEKHNGEITYDSVNEMTYMSSIISETQRKFTLSLTKRIAGYDYEYKGLKMKKGQRVAFLNYAMSHDGEIYPEPNKFDPERERFPDSFLPFGTGPRMCVGSRLALLEVKMVLSTILSKYRFEKCDKTIEKPTMDNKGIGGFKEEVILKIVKQ